MVGNIAGINEDKINSLILEIYDYAESVNKILNEIDDLLQDNIKYFDLELKDEIWDFHKELRANFPIVTQNILSYATDLMNLKKYYSNVASNITLDLNRSNNK